MFIVVFLPTSPVSHIYNMATPPPPPDESPRQTPSAHSHIIPLLSGVVRSTAGCSCYPSLMSLPIPPPLNLQVTKSARCGMLLEAFGRFEGYWRAERGDHAAGEQGLTLVHSSAQLERLLCVRGCS